MEVKMSRIFDGKTFREATAAPTRASAEIVAAEWRNNGWNARVVKKKHSYTIYVRRK
ncbi:MAG: hypothetical protein WC262_11125 [Bacteroidales bacterium]